MTWEIDYITMECSERKNVQGLYQRVVLLNQRLVSNLVLFFYKYVLCFCCNNQFGRDSARQGLSTKNEVVQGVLKYSWWVLDIAIVLAIP